MVSVCFSGYHICVLVGIIFVFLVGIIFVFCDTVTIKIGFMCTSPQSSSDQSRQNSTPYIHVAYYMVYNMSTGYSSGINFSVGGSK